MLALQEKRQRWAELVATGTNPAKAYATVWVGNQSPDACRRGVSRLSRNASVMEEVSRIRKRVEMEAGGAVMTLLEKRRYLAEIVRTPVGQLSPMSPLAQEVKRAKPLATAEQPALFTAEQVEATEWETVRMPDKLKAIELDAKLAGEFAEDKAATAHAGAADALAKVMAEVASRHTPAEAATPLSWSVWQKLDAAQTSAHSPEAATPL